MREKIVVASDPQDVEALAERICDAIGEVQPAPVKQEPVAFDCQGEMLLDEAIQHAKAKGYGNSDCAAQHRQLASWLEDYAGMLCRTQPAPDVAAMQARIAELERDNSILQGAYDEAAIQVEELERVQGVLVDALEDMNAGWKYIRSFHGDLYGVGWDRAQDKADAALAEVQKP